MLHLFWISLLGVTLPCPWLSVAQHFDPLEDKGDVAWDPLLISQKKTPKAYKYFRIVFHSTENTVFLTETVDSYWNINQIKIVMKTARKPSVK